MQELEDILYGTDNTDPRLPLPDEVIELMGSTDYDIELNENNIRVSVGNTATLKATVSPKDQAVTWTSSDTSVATVADGVVTGVAAGSTTVTASFTADNDTYSAECTVRVRA
jgi:uncharacterized protein YjdB